jgi:AraC family transcriptional regulator of adaptative response/methylated-DNA-[protein]-cysteine methyltransferase
LLGVGVARSAKGAIALADDRRACSGDLRQQFPVRNPRDARALAATLKVVRLSSLAAGIDLPLDENGIQQRVACASGIPSGTTASYADIARKIDQPAAVRAVRSAAPPAGARVLYRVVRSDGALSGYRGDRPARAAGSGARARR